jgi:hypothetical protein
MYIHTICTFVHILDAGAMGREIESRQGTYKVVALF